MMAGGGSIQSMQTALKNNRNLLKRKKKGFFKRDLSYAELKKYYKESTEPIKNKEIKNLKAVEQIRKRIIKRQRRLFLLQLVLTGIVLTALSLGIYHVLNSTAIPESIRKTESKNYVIHKQESFIENMSLGKLKMKSGDYFMAAGNFKNALQLKPGDIHAEFNLAKAFCKLCKHKKQACNEADSLVRSMETKYPNQQSFTQLRKIYLSKR